MGGKIKGIIEGKGYGDKLDTLQYLIKEYQEFKFLIMILRNLKN